MAKKRGKDTTDGEEGGKQPSSKLPLIIGGAAAVLVAGGGGAYFMIKPKPEAPVAAMESTEAGAKTAAKGEMKKPSAFVDLPEMTVNLALGSGERQQFLKVKVSLEVADQKTVPEIQPMLPRVMDAFQVFMRELRPNDLEGSAGLHRLKEEMIRRVNVAVYPAKVDAVLFKEVLVQ